MNFDPAVNRKQIQSSPTYRMAEDDAEFIKSSPLRPMRVAMELMKAEIVQQREKIVATIVVFGGTRIMKRSQAELALAEAQEALARSPGNAQLQATAALAQGRVQRSRYYDDAREFGRIVAEACACGSCPEFVITTGGGPGVMEAANRGAREANGRTMGLNITLPTEQEPNPYINPELCLQFHYFAVRKINFLVRARALVAFPGGYGTLDELFETLTLIQTGVMERVPVVLFGSEWWKKLINFEMLVEEGMIAPQDIGLFTYADTAKEAWEDIRSFYAARGMAVEGSPLHPWSKRPTAH
ncbi:MAG: TIGR00730 family Rossman fold protein [Planctomycetes bacterium]|nr:TIGR00730 family Rossman fold protein [Planctomycetota bacterium]